MRPADKLLLCAQPSAWQSVRCPGEPWASSEVVSGSPPSRPLLLRGISGMQCLLFIGMPRSQHQDTDMCSNTGPAHGMPGLAHSIKDLLTAVQDWYSA